MCLVRPEFEEVHFVTLGARRTLVALHAKGGSFKHAVDFVQVCARCLRSNCLLYVDPELVWLR